MYKLLFYNHLDQTNESSVIYILSSFCDSFSWCQQEDLDVNSSFNRFSAMNIRQYFSVNSSSGTLIGMRVVLPEGSGWGKILIYLSQKYSTNSGPSNCFHHLTRPHLTSLHLSHCHPTSLLLHIDRHRPSSKHSRKIALVMCSSSTGHLPPVQ
jgi:hypothetical protein